MYACKQLRVELYISRNTRSAVNIWHTKIFRVPHFNMQLFHIAACTVFILFYYDRDETSPRALVSLR